ncbi:hypothetical protein Pcinc_031201 [Petrolisthes cinctipes]|uniref:Uncharacterized protein n=1 Tax=Petrolisthes cinctipes TaxID=88211 RepID=A0AAE1EWK4_PETCI|nr:hypothetical protein Pcinc_031201 [Petrolisthes cinctipes]
MVVVVVVVVRVQGVVWCGVAGVRVRDESEGAVICLVLIRVLTWPAGGAAIKVREAARTTLLIRVRTRHPIPPSLDPLNTSPHLTTPSDVTTIELTAPTHHNSPYLHLTAFIFLWLTADLSLVSLIFHLTPLIFPWLHSSSHGPTHLPMAPLIFPWPHSSSSGFTHLPMAPLIFFLASLIITCPPSSSHVLPHHHLSSLIITCPPSSSLVLPHHHLSSLIITCPPSSSPVLPHIHLSSLIITCPHSSSPVLPHIHLTLIITT